MVTQLSFNKYMLVFLFKLSYWKLRKNLLQNSTSSDFSCGILLNGVLVATGEFNVLTITVSVSSNGLIPVIVYWNTFSFTFYLQHPVLILLFSLCYMTDSPTFEPCATTRLIFLSIQIVLILSIPMRLLRTTHSADIFQHVNWNLRSNGLTHSSPCLCY